MLARAAFVTACPGYAAKPVCGGMVIILMKGRRNWPGERLCEAVAWLNEIRGRVSPNSIGT